MSADLGTPVVAASAGGGLVLDATQLFDASRRANSVNCSGVQLFRVPFACSTTERLLPVDRSWPENNAFDCFLFTPEGHGAWSQAVVILNGLNDSNYRKFYPWAASLASSGVPAVVFPTALLMNRRPRAWTSPRATQAAYESRAAIAGTSVTPINAVLSARVADRPRSLLHDVLQTALDVQLLSELLQRGELQNADGRKPFAPGTRVHLLGYSLGGYLALAMQLGGLLQRGARVVTFCAGASLHGAPQARANPVSPYILDAQACAALLTDLQRLQSESTDFDDLTQLLLQLFAGTSAVLRERIAALGDQLTVCGSSRDRVIPVRGIVDNLGRLDRNLDAGSHEYPFNIGDSDDPEALRSIAGSHRVAPRFADAFQQFIEAVLETVQCDAT